MLLREHGRDGWSDAAESQPALPYQLIKRLDDLVPDPEVDVRPDERAAVEACVHRKPGATFRACSSVIIAPPTMKGKKSGDGS